MTPIKIRAATLKRLGKLGRKGEDYDGTLNRLIDFYRARKFRAEAQT